MFSSKHLTTLLVVLTVLAGLTGAVGSAGAQETATATPTETPTPAANATTPFAGDPTLEIERWDYNRGTFRVLLDADVPRLLTVTAMPASRSESGGGRIKQVRLTRGRNLVTMPAESGLVFMTTPTSVNNGRYHYLDASGPPLVGGPWSGTDVRDAVAYALLTGGVVLLVLAIRAKLGLDESAGWVA